jgi:hypothetical protein
MLGNIQQQVQKNLQQLNSAFTQPPIPLQNQQGTACVPAMQRQMPSITSSTSTTPGTNSVSHLVWNMSPTVVNQEVRGQISKNVPPSGEGKALNHIGVCSEGTLVSKLVLKSVSFPDGSRLEGLSDGDIQLGEFRDNKFNGKGKFIFQGGEIHEGEFVNGQLIQGKITFPSGNIQEGEFKAGMLNGKGKITLATGQVDEGNFKDGRLIQGKVTFPSGKIQEGEYKNGMLNGKGKITVANGTSGEGEFVNGMLNGQGKITSPSGVIKEGNFKDGKLTGQGKITFPSGEIQEGEFKNGMLNGKGKITLASGTVEEGNFKDGQLIQGKITFPGGNIQEGNFNKDRLNGKGKITFAAGQVEEGNFKDCKLIQGKVTFPCGSIKEGEFKDNMLITGKSQTTKANGDIVECEVKDGKSINTRIILADSTKEDAASVGK